MASDLRTALEALLRVQAACRPRAVPGPKGGSVSPHQTRLLAFLDRADPAMVGELAESMGVTASTMSLTLARLESRGLVRRDRDPEDRRVTNVRLTEEGERIRDAAVPLDADSLDAALRRLRAVDRPQVVRCLQLLADAADGAVGPAGGGER